MECVDGCVDLDALTDLLGYSVDTGVRRLRAVAQQVKQLTPLLLKEQEAKVDERKAIARSVYSEGRYRKFALVWKPLFGFGLFAVAGLLVCSGSFACGL